MCEGACGGKITAVNVIKNIEQRLSSLKSTDAIAFLSVNAYRFM